MALSPVSGQYDETVDRESAYEKLDEARRAVSRSENRGDAATIDGATCRQRGEPPRSRTGFQLPDFGGDGGSEDDETSASATTATSVRHVRPKAAKPARTAPSNRQTVTEAAIKSMTRTVASSLGRALVRGILGSLKKVL